MVICSPAESLPDCPKRHAEHMYACLSGRQHQRLGPTSHSLVSLSDSLVVCGPLVSIYLMFYLLTVTKLEKFIFQFNGWLECNIIHNIYAKKQYNFLKLWHTFKLREIKCKTSILASLERFSLTRILMHIYKIMAHVLMPLGYVGLPSSSLNGLRLLLLYS